MNKGAFFCLCLISSQAFADSVRMEMSEQNCVRLLAASAEYVPGISTTGQTVAPADLNDGPEVTLPDPDNMTLPVYVVLKRGFPFWESDLEAGVLPAAQAEVKDGQVFVNGTLVSEDVHDTLKMACQKRLEEENLDKKYLTKVQ
ncbi:MAG: hypothetical protein IJ752_07720 [Alphaproteobacteria bacterium]|nr:hypothetical protein [Alphaproteobacteria bacterium]